MENDEMQRIYELGELIGVNDPAPGTPADAAPCADKLAYLLAQLEAMHRKMLEEVAAGRR